MLQEAGGGLRSRAHLRCSPRISGARLRDRKESSGIRVQLDARRLLTAATTAPTHESAKASEAGRPSPGWDPIPWSFMSDWIVAEMICDPLK